MKSGIRHWWLLVATGAVLLLVAVAAGAVFLFSAWRGEPRHFSGGEAIVVVPRGAAVGQVAEQLARTFGDAPIGWYLLAKVRQTQRVVAGYYHFPDGTSPEAAWRMVERGEVIRDRLTIVEGWTFAQMRAAIDAHPYLTHTLAGASSEAILQAIGAKVPYAEGWFFPDTYFFDRMSTDRDLYRQAHERMKEVLAAVWAGRDPDLPLTSPEELLILASLIEKETSHPEDRPKVAAVFVNRLRHGMPLQSDPTVAYGLSEGFVGPLTTRHLKSDHPHNTYTRSGLPPTPIALPGRAALEAAAHPERSDYLYFVATGVDARSVFSRTLEEHNRAVRAYRRAVAEAKGSTAAGRPHGEQP